MQFSIALTDLEHLTGLSGLTDQSGGALDARLREAFAFLPEDSEFSVDDQGVLLLRPSRHRSVSGLPLNAGWN